MKIYTKTGDKGVTSLYGGTKVPKHHLHIETYGNIDELNAWIGLLKDQNINKRHKKVLLQIQNNLFIIGTLLATPKKTSTNKKLHIPTLPNNVVTILENEIDEIDSTLPTMTHFILPGGHPIVSYCHIARTVCRRAERSICLLYDELQMSNQLIISYLNRMSDYLFVLSRKLANTLNIEEIKWVSRNQ